MDVFRDRFLGLLAEMPSDNDRRSFLAWIKDDICIDAGVGDDVHDARVAARAKLHTISQAVLEHLPNPEANFSTERLTFPTRFAADGDVLTEANTIFLDAFLYDAATEEAMIEEGVLPTAYCKVCRSKDIENYNYVTHSCSKEVLEAIFTSLLPPLPADTVVLDVGSRLGAVLYGAYVFTQAKYIVGVEMNEELCKIQGQVCNTFGLTDRVNIECSEMTTRLDLFQKANVVVLNNVFEFFVTEDGGARASMWKFLRTAMRPGTLVVSSPSIEKSLSTIQTGIEINSWVEELPPFRPIEDSSEKTDSEIDKFCLYRVKP